MESSARMLSGAIAVAALISCESPEPVSTIPTEPKPLSGPVLQIDWIDATTTRAEIQERFGAPHFTMVGDHMWSYRILPVREGPRLYWGYVERGQDVAWVRCEEVPRMPQPRDADIRWPLEHDLLLLFTPDGRVARHRVQRAAERGRSWLFVAY